MGVFATAGLYELVLSVLSPNSCHGKGKPRLRRLHDLDIVLVASAKPVHSNHWDMIMPTLSSQHPAALRCTKYRTALLAPEAAY